MIANVDSSLNSTSVNPVQNKVLYDPVTFAESERQKSKNLFDLNYNGTFNSKTETSVSEYISLKSVYGEKFTINTDLPQYSFSRGSVGDIYTNIIFNNLKPSTSYTISFVPISVDNDVAVHFLGVYNVQDKLNTKVTKTITTDENGQFNTGYGIWINGQNTTFVVKDIQLEEGTVATDYQPYNGAITHNNDAPVVFAELERQKSKNLLNILNASSYTTNGVTLTIEDNIITLNGTTTGFTTFIRPHQLIRANVGKYAFSFKHISGTISGNSGPQSLYNQVGKNEIYYPNISSINDITEVTDYDQLRIAISANITFNNFKYSLQYEQGNVATDYQPYNGSIVHDKQLTEQLSNYLPLSGGTMTGQIKLHTNGFRTNSDDGYYTDAYGNFIYLGNSNTANFQIKDNTATAQIKAFYKSGRIETNGGIRINASGATTATSEYPVDIRRSSSGGDTAIKVTRTDTEKSMYFGIGSGGENRGIYDLTKNG